MVQSLKISYILTFFAFCFCSRIHGKDLIIFHDCGHGSFFKSKRLNTIVGVITGLFTFTPFHKWTRDHKVHHSTVGNLDQRGIGDVPTLTTEEFIKLSGGKIKISVLSGIPSFYLELLLCYFLFSSTGLQENI